MDDSKILYCLHNIQKAGNKIYTFKYIYKKYKKLSLVILDAASEFRHRNIIKYSMNIRFGKKD